MKLLCLVAVVSLRCATAENDGTGTESENTVEGHQGELINLQIITTNGLSSPVELYPADPNRAGAWRFGLGKLTKIGKVQQYQMGKFLREVYEDFITTNPKEVEVFSASEDRTLESALCHLAALYSPSKEWQFLPNYEWQPIPIAYTDAESDKYTGLKPQCPKFEKEQKKILKTSAGRVFIQQDQFLFEYWTNNSGLVINNWNDVNRLYQTLYRERRFGLVVPRWALDYWKDMKRISDAAYSWNFSTKLAMKLRVGPLIELLTQRMLFLAEEDNPTSLTKVNVYVTHDWNMAALLNSMFRFNNVQPEPCTTLAVELYQFYDTYTVRVVLFNTNSPGNGTPKQTPLMLRGCAEYCPLAYFANYFKDYVPKNWIKSCGIRKKPKEVEPEESGIPFSDSG